VNATFAVVAATAAAVVAAIALRVRALDRGGALAAWAIGTATLAVGGIAPALVVLAFFLSSSALSRIGRARKRALLDGAKDGPRDARQVLANGGIATGCLLAAAALPAHREALLAAFAGAYAAACADTWGTEIGMLAAAPVRSILTLLPIQPGLSGGITMQGTLAEGAGAAFIAACARWSALAPFIPVAMGGIAGALLDSILGATMQHRRFCPTCARICETEVHRCGTSTVPHSGLRALDNDTVNLAATACGAAVAYVAAPYFF